MDGGPGSGYCGLMGQLNRRSAERRTRIKQIPFFSLCGDGLVNAVEEIEITIVDTIVAEVICRDAG